MSIKGKIFESKETGNKVKVIAENTPCHYMHEDTENVTTEWVDRNGKKQSRTVSKVIFLQYFVEIKNGD